MVGRVASIERLIEEAGNDEQRADRTERPGTSRSLSVKNAGRRTMENYR
jgi:hypothetical protein